MELFALDLGEQLALAHEHRQRERIENFDNTRAKEGTAILPHRL